MAIEEKIQADFKEFIAKVFPNAGEQQLSDMNLIWYAGVFCATNVTAQYGDLTAVHIAAYDILKLHNEFALAQIKG